MSRHCPDCGTEIGRYSVRCKSCAAAERWRVNRDRYLAQLEAARRNSHTVSARKRSVKRMSEGGRVRFDADAIRDAVFDEGMTYASVERVARLPLGSLGTELRKRTMPYHTLDRIAIALGRHPSEFEVMEVNA